MFLSDGAFNLALTPVREGVEPGLRYLGFEAARGEIIKEKVANTEHAKRIKSWQVEDPDIEYEIRDPDGNLIGLNSAPSTRRTLKARRPSVMSRCSRRTRGCCVISIARCSV